MEKTVHLDPHEQQAAAQIEQQRMQALAQIGAAKLDAEQAEINDKRARERLRALKEQEEMFLRQTLAAHGIDRFDSAHAGPGVIVANLADGPPAALESAKTNGLDHHPEG